MMQTECHFPLFCFSIFVVVSFTLFAYHLHCQWWLDSLYGNLWLNTIQRNFKYGFLPKMLCNEQFFVCRFKIFLQRKNFQIGMHQQVGNAIAASEPYVVESNKFCISRKKGFFFQNIQLVEELFIFSYQRLLKYQMTQRSVKFHLTKLQIEEAKKCKEMMKINKFEKAYAESEFVGCFTSFITSLFRFFNLFLSFHAIIYIYKNMLFHFLFLFPYLSPLFFFN